MKEIEDFRLKIEDWVEDRIANPVIQSTMQSTILNLQSKISCYICALLLAATVVSTACSSAAGGLFRQYEYEEEMYLSLDGTATVYVNASVAALDALRGASFDAHAGARVDRERVRQMYTAPATHVVSLPTTSRRSGRQFVHVRLDVADVRTLAAAAPFSWSRYEFGRDGELFVFRQSVGRGKGTDVGDVGWNGRERVAFRLHLPSEIVYHNAGPGNPRRGNILVWEQPLADRLRGVPLVLDARMKSHSILYRTLWLFAASFGAVAVMFGALIWWIRREPRALNPDRMQP
jgi:hypothetical protein